MIKLLTWNIWFNKKYMELRFCEILRLVKKSDPDICCFQEVVPEFIELMGLDTHWFDNYDFSDLDVSPYGTILCVKKYFEFGFKSYDLTSKMGRKLIIGSNPDLVVGTVHLESLDSQPIRLTQLQEIKELLDSYGSVSKILCGDFNFCSQANYKPNPNIPLENLNLIHTFPDYLDQWAGAGSTHVPTWKHMRLDRILTKLNPGLRVGAKSLIGTKPVLGTAQTAPSDHLGLVLEIN